MLLPQPLLLCQLDGLLILFNIKLLEILIEKLLYFPLSWPLTMDWLIVLDPVLVELVNVFGGLDLAPCSLQTPLLIFVFYRSDLVSGVLVIFRSRYVLVNG